MKPFRFPLKSLRVLREQKERVAQKHYVEALRASEAAASRLDAASHELAAAWMALCEQAAEGVSIARLLQTRSWCGELERRSNQLAAALKSAQRLAHDAWHDMVLATRDREALDKLRDKRRQAYDRDVQHEGQKQLDEMGLRLAFSTKALGEPLIIQTEEP